jgi:hypothetical protein
MPMRDRLDYLLAEPFSEFHDPPLVARWAEVPALARESQKILMTTLFASDAGKPVVEVTAVEIPVNHLPDIGTEKPILFFKPLFIHLSECLEMIFNSTDSTLNSDDCEADRQDLCLA